MKIRGYVSKIIDKITKRLPYTQYVEEQLEESRRANIALIGEIQKHERRNSGLASRLETQVSQAHNSFDETNKLREQLKKTEPWVLRGICAKIESASNKPYLVLKNGKIVYTSDKIRRPAKHQEITGESFFKLQHDSEYLNEREKQTYVKIYRHVYKVKQVSAPSGHQVVNLTMDRKLTTKLREEERKLRRQGNLYHLKAHKTI